LTAHLLKAQIRKEKGESRSSPLPFDRSRKVS
jgi:hypothetical protein